MRYVQLRAFHYVAIYGGFSRAAEALYLTQPAISDQVRKLEEEYDILLFYRHKKQVTLTESGQKLLEITHRLFEVEKQANELLSESRAFRTGNLTIFADAAHHLLGILRAFRDRYPDVKISVNTGNTDSVVKALYSYEADIGILGEVPNTQDFEIHKLSSSPIIAFASVNHPASKAQSLTLEQLAEMPLIFREQGSKTRRKLEDLAASKGIELLPVIEAEGREAVREIVASGAGIGFVSKAEFSADMRLKAIQISSDEMLMDEAAICLNERSSGALIRAFMEIARSKL
ncbi:LysR family transcriptional regulator [Ochrobactrum sp. POC9]|uniref:LysR substrate-binding domain-containing protein n=1 Tax=unclassified Ochrobactrum TaxID=239106 RepID=UPI000D706098|nr:LysR substrate-binding domain-containing protein [Ochrobactrum sp. POC9]MCH4542167.1 LysR substrate-binding domain-containing protein [Ochrobactrum sp. A-1]PWU71337.1 LysR family transcriptional regulator [Ochrobactrum sp. POC9]